MTLFHKELDPVAHICHIHDYVLQAQVGDNWAPWGDDGAMLTIDRLGRAFSQDAETGCVFNGTVIKTVRHIAEADRGDPYNLFTVALDVEGCTEPAYLKYNGRTLRGFAFLDETLLEDDTLVVMAAVRVPEGYGAIGRRYRRQ
jgi:hypothetical protein